VFACVGALVRLVPLAGGEIAVCAGASARLQAVRNIARPRPASANLFGGFIMLD